MRLLRPTAASCVTVGHIVNTALHVTPTAQRSVHRHKIVRAWRLQVPEHSAIPTLPTLPISTYPRKRCSVSLIVDSIGNRRLPKSPTASFHPSGGTCMLRKWTSLALCCWKKRLWIATLPINSILSLSAKCSILVIELWENWGMVRKLLCGCVGMLGG